MKAIWDSCVAAGIDPPEEVQEFFNYSAPDDVEVELELEEWSDDCREGHEIDLDKIPKHVNGKRPNKSTTFDQCS